MAGHNDALNQGGNILLQNGSIQIQQPGRSPAMDQSVSVKKKKKKKEQIHFCLKKILVNPGSWTQGFLDV